MQTAGLVSMLAVPLIVLGQIHQCHGDAARVLAETGAAGLMLGRGAIADPLLFRRIRGEAPPDPTTKKCPECLSDIPIAARRCAFCTSAVGGK